MEQTRPTIILIISPPGAGKSTLCQKIASQFKLVHLSIGEILRQQRKFDTKQGHQLDSFMKQFQKVGKLMPCDIPIKYLVKRMRAHGWEKSVYLVDGFIKSVFMYHYWDQVLSDAVNVVGCIYLECSKQTCLKRLEGRAKTSNRQDDKNSDLFRIRLKTFFQITYPVIALYQKQGILRTINSQRSLEEVFQEAKILVLELIVR